MKLSDAIRLGATLRPQGHYGLFEDVIGVYQQASCALGAAGEAVGVFRPITITHRDSDYDALKERFPILNRTVACPACASDEHRGDLDDLIIILNDDHLWTREQIADHVATIEASHESSAAVAPQEAVTV